MITGALCRRGKEGRAAGFPRFASALAIVERERRHYMFVRPSCSELRLRLALTVPLDPRSLS